MTKCYNIRPINKLNYIIICILYILLSCIVQQYLADPSFDIDFDVTSPQSRYKPIPLVIRVEDPPLNLGELKLAIKSLYLLLPCQTLSSSLTALSVSIPLNPFVDITDTESNSNTIIHEYTPYNNIQQWYSYIDSLTPCGIVGIRLELKYENDDSQQVIYSSGLLSASTALNDMIIQPKPLISSQQWALRKSAVRDLIDPLSNTYSLDTEYIHNIYYTNINQRSNFQLIMTWLAWYPQPTTTTSYIYTINLYNYSNDNNICTLTIPYADIEYTAYYTMHSIALDMTSLLSTCNISINDLYNIHNNIYYTIQYNLSSSSVYAQYSIIQKSLNRINIIQGQDIISNVTYYPINRDMGYDARDSNKLIGVTSDGFILSPLADTNANIYIQTNVYTELTCSMDIEIFKINYDDTSQVTYDYRGRSTSPATIQTRTNNKEWGMIISGFTALQVNLDILNNIIADTTSVYGTTQYALYFSLNRCAGYIYESVDPNSINETYMIDRIEQYNKMIYIIPTYSIDHVIITPTISTPASIKAMGKDESKLTVRIYTIDRKSEYRVEVQYSGSYIDDYNMMNEPDNATKIPFTEYTTRESITIPVIPSSSSFYTVQHVLESIDIFKELEEILNVSKIYRIIDLTITITRNSPNEEKIGTYYQDINKNSIDICRLPWTFDCSENLQGLCSPSGTQIWDDSHDISTCLCESSHTGKYCDQPKICEAEYITLDECNYNGFVAATHDSNNNTYTCDQGCSCKPGWIGKTCRQNDMCTDAYYTHEQCSGHGIIDIIQVEETDGTISNHCLNQCRCDVNWSGEICDTRIELCIEQYNILDQCSLHGFVGINTTTGDCNTDCQCNDGWEGTTCQYTTQCSIAMMDFDQTQCINGTVPTQYIDPDTSYCTISCQCPVGFTGPNCQIHQDCMGEYNNRNECFNRGIIAYDSLLEQCDTICTCTSEWDLASCQQPAQCTPQYTNLLSSCSLRGYVDVDHRNECNEECTCFDNRWYGDQCQYTDSCEAAVDEIEQNLVGIGQEIVTVVDYESGQCIAHIGCDNSMNNNEICSGHGFFRAVSLTECDTQCTCNTGWYGDQCEHHYDCQNTYTVLKKCSGRGTIVYDQITKTCSEECECYDADTWTGSTCEQPVKCQTQSNILSCAYGIVSLIQDPSNTNQQVCSAICSCQFGYVGKFCSECPIQCFNRNEVNIKAYCQDNLTTTPPCICRTNYIGRYCQYFEMNTIITIQNRYLPSWLVSSIESKKLHNTRTSLFISTLIDNINNLLEFNDNTLINLGDTSVPQIYQTDPQNRTNIAINTMSIGYTTCQIQNNDNDNENNNDTSSNSNSNNVILPSKLTFLISTRVGTSLSTLTKELNDVQRKWTNISVNTRALTTTLSNIMDEMYIQRLQDSSQFKECEGAVEIDDDDDFVVDIDLEGPSDDTGENKEESTNMAYNYINILGIIIICNYLTILFVL